MPGDYVDKAKRISCANEGDFLLKHFPYSKESILEMEESEIQCKKYCGAKTGCFGCVHHSNENCRWTAVSHCKVKDNLNHTMPMKISIKPGEF